jgi:hypothetical protein
MASDLPSRAIRCRHPVNKFGSKSKQSSASMPRASTSGLFDVSKEIIRVKGDISADVPQTRPHPEERVFAAQARGSSG